MWRPQTTAGGQIGYSRLPENEDDTSGGSAASPRDYRLILLGGDEQAQQDVSKFILRTENIRGPCDSVYEGSVEERNVRVVNTPSFWMKHLASFFFFNRKLKTIKNDLQSCISRVFPGPHAFLLVLQADGKSRKERYLLQAISSVFGDEALDYTLVLFIHNNQTNPERAVRKSSVRTCGGRHHFLEDTDRSVQELFQEIENMIDGKPSRFFIPTSYENYMKLYFGSWEDKQSHHLNEVCKELEEMKVTNQNLRKEMEDQFKKHLSELTKCKDTVSGNEGMLRKNLEDSQQRERELRQEVENSQLKERKLRQDLEDSKQRERQLRQDLEDSQQKENKLGRELKDSQRRETELEKKLENSQQKERELRKDLEDSRQRENKLRQEVEDSQQKEKENSQQRENKLRKKLDFSEVRENELRRKLNDSQRRESELRKELDGAKRRLTELEKVSGDSNIQDREEKEKDRGTETENKERSLQVSGTALGSKGNNTPGSHQM